MKFEQDDKTVKFMQAVKSLVDSGSFGTEKEIAKELDYNYSALNQIMNGGRNVPQKIYKKFTERFKPVEITTEGQIYTIGLQNQALSRVILRALAEVLSKQRDESVTKTISDLEAAVRAEIQQVSGK